MICLRWPGISHRSVAAVLLVAAVIAACGEGGTGEAPRLAIDTTGVKVVFSDPLNSDAHCSIDDEPLFTVGADQGDPAYVLEVVGGAARLSDGSIAVLENITGEVRIFGPDGLHLRSMGTKGRDPGEFRIGKFIWVLPGDTLWVGDYRPWRFNVYASSGEFVRTVQLQPRMFFSAGGGVLDNGWSVNVREGRPRIDVSSPTPGLLTSPTPYGVEVQAADGSHIRQLGTLHGPRIGGPADSKVNLRALFDPVPSIDARGTTIAITTAMEPEVLVLDDALRPRHIVRWSDPDRQVTSAHIQAYRDRVIEAPGGRGSESWDESDEFSVSGERPAAEVFPTVSYLKIGRDGRLWVARYRRPGERRAWMVFEPEGDFICWCPQLPVTPYEFGSDYVLGRRTDDGVTRVMMYEWHLPGGDTDPKGGES